jgi:hypothetical protein
MANSDELLLKYDVEQAISFLKENHQCKSLDILLNAYYTQKEALKSVSEDSKELKTRFTNLFQEYKKLVISKEAK